MNSYYSKIDSERFGFKIAKFGNDVDNAIDVVDELKRDGFRLIIARTEFTNLSLINTLEKIGFVYKDAQLTFGYDMKRELPLRLTSTVMMHPYRDAFQDRLIQITENSFQEYGHYFADERLDRHSCRQIYIDWVYRCCTDKLVSDHMIVAVLDEEPIGYLALKTVKENEQFHLAGIIGAVSSKHRHLGVFRMINIESLYLSNSLGAAHYEGNVHLTNFPVMKTYTSLSYRIIRSEITLHLWLD
ncbi:MAG: hypothetical protein Q8M98_11565 [Candidatus Cloacimonadaceae bacterium]|nr:hypothetical protein [Candidatus Cloacimonadaceae bacterium]